MPGPFTYGQYQSAAYTGSNGGENGNISNLSEDEWNNLTPQQQIDLVFSVGGTPGGWSGGSTGRHFQSSAIPGTELKDPSQMTRDEYGVYSTPNSNLVDRTGGINWRMAMIPLLAGGGAALMGGEGAAGGEAAGKGGAGASPGGYVDVIGNAAEGAWAGSPTTGALGAGAGALGDSSGYIDQIGNAAEGANAGASLTGPVTPGWEGRIRQLTGGLLDNAAANPLSTAIRALGLGQTVAGLLGGNGGKPSGGSQYEPPGGKGGSGQALKQTPLTVNPYTLSQVQNYRPIAPRRMI